MSHSRIFALRRVADSKKGDYPEVKEPWKIIRSGTDLPFDWCSEFADYIDDVSDTEWNEDVEWLTNNIFHRSGGEAVYKNIDGALHIKIKVGDLKSRLIEQYDRLKELVDDMPITGLADSMQRYCLLNAINDKFGFHIIDMTEVKDVDNIYTLDEWVGDTYTHLTDNGTYGIGLKDDDEVIYRVEGVIDYHS